MKKTIAAICTAAIIVTAGTAVFAAGTRSEVNPVRLNVFLKNHPKVAQALKGRLNIAREKFAAALTVEQKAQLDSLREQWGSLRSKVQAVRQEYRKAAEQNNTAEMDRIKAAAPALREETKALREKTSAFRQSVKASQ